MANCLNCNWKKTKSKTGLCRKCYTLKKQLINNVIRLNKKHEFLVTRLRLKSFSVKGLNEELLRMETEIKQYGINKKVKVV